jgi:putative endonuclease
MPYLYILHSASIDKFYVGSTSGTPEERLKKHLTNHSGFTGKAKDWKIVHREFFDSAELVRQRELQVKAWKSKYKILEIIA